MSYLDTTADLYREAAIAPQANLCCVSSPPLQLPGLVVPPIMHEMNYGCGSTVHPQELGGSPTVLYLGVGGGLEALQFAYFSRRPGGVIAVDPVAEMREVAARNLALAAGSNDWFAPTFVEIRDGDAFALPVPDASVDVIAQNCLFNIFELPDLDRALAEARRVLKPGGRLIMSDPIAPHEIPAHLRADERLRAMCLSGSLTYKQYIQRIIRAGFGQIEVRARRPYRLLDAPSYGLDEDLLLESLDTVCFNLPIPEDGACVFTGRTAIYRGPEPLFDDGAGHVLPVGIPTAVCDKTAAKLSQGFPERIRVTESTWYYSGGGCC